MPKKLCAALVAFFIHFSHLWPNCTRHLLYCLDSGHSLPVSNLSDAPQTATLVDSLDRSKVRAAMWFASTLVEDVGKTDMNSPK